VEVSHKSPNNLAILNLWRGNAMGSPSGGNEARATGLTPLEPSELWIGKAQKDNNGAPDKVIDVAGIANDAFIDKPPLWSYSLAEANVQWLTAVKNKSVDSSNKTAVSLRPCRRQNRDGNPARAAARRPYAFVNQEPLFTPRMLVAKPDAFTMGDFVTYALRA
jgi:hypothetical protein